ncbi:MAG: hypothetical protein V4548_00495 [Bacteroidota bacterium]
MKRKNSDGTFDFGIYEVFYDENGKANGWSENSLTPVCDSEDDLKQEMNIMINAFEKETLLYEETK